MEKKENELSELVESLKILPQIYDHNKDMVSLMNSLKTTVDNLNDTVGNVKNTVDGHDVLIREWAEIYKTAGTLKKMLINIIIGVPAFSAFAASLLYLFNLYEKTNK